MTFSTGNPSNFMVAQRRCLFGLAFVLSVAFPVAAAGQTPTVLLQTGSAAPNQNTFTGFGLASLNAGQVSYWGDVQGSATSYGIYETSVSTGSTLLIAQGSASAPGGGVYNRIFANATNPPEIDTSGDVGFSSIASNGSVNALFVSSGSPPTVTRSVAAGQAAPDGNGTFSNVPTGFSMNNSGQIGFEGTLTGTTHGSTDNLGMYRVAKGGTALTQIARYGATVPGGNGTFGGTHVINSAFWGGLLNDAGMVAFTASITGSSLASDEAVYTGNGSTLAQMARVGDIATGHGTATLTSFSSAPALNASGAVGFVASYSSGSSIYRAGPGGGLTEIAFAGENLASGGYIYSLPQAVAINTSGQVAGLIATNTSATANIGSGGLIRGSGGALTVIARNGQATPRQDGATFSFFGNSSFALNDSGNLAFTANLIKPSSTSFPGLFYYSDSGGLVEILQYGDSFDGSTITGISLAGTTATTSADPNKTGLDSANRVVFTFTLANNQSGIAVWNSQSQSAAPTDTPLLPIWALILLSSALLLLGSFYNLSGDRPISQNR